jgi:hypothetical protein
MRHCLARLNPISTTRVGALKETRGGRSVVVRRATLLSPDAIPTAELGGRRQRSSFIVQKRRN